MRNITKKSNINLDCYFVEMGFEYVPKNLFKSKNICQTIIAIQLFLFATRIELRSKLHQNLVSKPGKYKNERQLWKNNCFSYGPIEFCVMFLPPRHYTEHVFII